MNYVEKHIFCKGFISKWKCIFTPVEVHLKKCIFRKQSIFWNVMQGSENNCFHPLNQFPPWTDPSLTLAERVYLDKYISYKEKI